MTNMNYIGLDVHKKTISYWVKDASGRVQQEGKVQIILWPGVEDLTAPSGSMLHNHITT